MKKILAVALCMITILAASSVTFAFEAIGRIVPHMTISEIKTATVDEANPHVQIDGQIIDRVCKDVYTFKDTNGDTINIKFYNENWYTIEMNKPICIYAEMNKNKSNNEVELTAISITDKH